MINLSSSIPLAVPAVPREEFDEFLNLLTHEIRNRLNIISLEASDLAEQLEGNVDISRLQGRVKDCSEFLKVIRDLAVPEDAGARKLPMAEVVACLRERRIEA